MPVIVGAAPPCTMDLVQMDLVRRSSPEVAMDPDGREPSRSFEMSLRLAVWWGLGVRALSD